ncbi:hypothetical protein GCM10009119_00770 [Algoriphagus jejuensis]|uniref:Superfamily III holin-X n=1 Tax=Algoriphagus jejuensis TaxID=419934 RepID=A0ABP3Y8E6_9BACT
MNRYFKGSGLAFYLLVILVTFILGTAVTGVSGVDDNQGLAGGAIILGYGLITAFGGFIIAIFIVSKASVSKLITANWIILSVIAVLMTFLILRAKFKTKEIKPDSTMPQKQTKPASTAEPNVNFETFFRELIEEA